MLSMIRGALDVALNIFSCQRITDDVNTAVVDDEENGRGSYAERYAFEKPHYLDDDQDR